ncbi:MAG: aminoacetone oxidase family FAD-binding enzyme [Fimbriimonadaceae bacterium]|nr:aminoacetone oxidase family FAD-binding enzyme [Fimbriimonadaceae bacterium]
MSKAWLYRSGHGTGTIQAVGTVVRDETDVAVIGGGAAGIIAAWRAAQLGVAVTLIEKTPRLGTKILISGGGKCNITHDGPLEEVLRAYRPAEARFIRPACYRFPNSRIVDMLTSRGLRVYTRPDGRIFPVDQTAKDVVRILESYLAEQRIHIQREAPVVGLATEPDGRFRIQIGPANLAHTGYRVTQDARVVREVVAKTVVLAAGGSSYPNCGTTGDAWPWAKSLGHTIAPIRAALAPMYLHILPERVEWSGVALRDIVTVARIQGKEVGRWRGDLLFTHHGISGPCALGLSRDVVEAMLSHDVTIAVDLRPDVTFEAIQTELQAANPKSLVATWLGSLVPDRLVDGLAHDAQIDPRTPFARLDRKSRNRLAETVKRWPLGQVRAVPLEKGEVVAGGISLDEVDPQTMQSRLIPNLFPCGEVLDIAGPVGGYNLLAAFSTGFVAGESAAKYAKTHAPITA